jgi:hypothetical protein
MMTESREEWLWNSGIIERFKPPEVRTNILPARLEFFKQHNCTRKHVYVSLIEAARAASFVRENHTNAEDIRPYRCLFNAAHYHVGNSSPEIRYDVYIVEEWLHAIGWIPEST